MAWYNMQTKRETFLYFIICNKNLSSFNIIRTVTEKEHRGRERKWWQHGACQNLCFNQFLSSSLWRINQEDESSGKVCTSDVTIHGTLLTLGQEGFDVNFYFGTFFSPFCILDFLPPGLSKIQKPENLASVFGPHRIFTISTDKKLKVPGKAGSSDERRIVLVPASFSGRDDTEGNSSSTMDNDRIELYMKDGIELCSRRWCCKQHASQWTVHEHRLLPLANWSQHP